jgi:Arc/MetJ-type ribon-helix-helix transcriptional regulator
VLKEQKTMHALKKKQTTITLDVEVMDFLQEQIKIKRFSSINHGVNYAVYKLMREESKST